MGVLDAEAGIRRRAVVRFERLLLAWLDLGMGWILSYARVYVRMTVDLIR